MKLIDKDALVAEIEKRKFYFSECGYPGMGQYEQGNKQGHLDTCDDIISIINSLEVKEADLEKRIGEYFKEWSDYQGIDSSVSTNSGDCATLDDIKDACRHFFELGLKVNNKKEK